MTNNGANGLHAQAASAVTVSDHSTVAGNTAGVFLKASTGTVDASLVEESGTQGLCAIAAAISTVVLATTKVVGSAKRGLDLANSTADVTMSQAMGHGEERLYAVDSTASPADSLVADHPRDGLVLENAAAGLERTTIERSGGVGLRASLRWAIRSPSPGRQSGSMVPQCSISTTPAPTPAARGSKATRGRRRAVNHRT